MDYLMHYNKLMESRKLRDPESLLYYEKHHILPRCMGGGDDDHNLVYLSFKEHYMAHYLLTKIYTKEPKIQYAFLCMLRDPHGHRSITSSMYATIKENYKKFKSWHSRYVYNPMRDSENVRLKASNRMKLNNPQHKPGNKCRRFTDSPTKGKIAYNNGIKNTYFIEGTQPSGWVAGLLPYRRNWNGGRRKT